MRQTNETLSSGSSEAASSGASIFQPDDPLIGVREIRMTLGVSDKWVRRGLARGTFPRPDYKLGTSLRWRRSSVEAYLREHAVSEGH
jgi:predicted DNA-binding transcriptional regulator AlpA